MLTAPYASVADKVGWCRLKLRPIFSYTIGNKFTGNSDGFQRVLFAFAYKAQRLLGIQRFSSAFSKWRLSPFIGLLKHTNEPSIST